MANETSDLALDVDLTVINGLGINLHGKLPPVMSEMVSNSWDADASRVEIRLPEGGIGPESRGVMRIEFLGFHVPA